MLKLNRLGLQTLLLIAFWSSPGFGQLSASSVSKPTAAPTNSAPAVPKDPRGRDTPQSAVLNFMKYAQRGDYDTAAQYLQLTTPAQTQHGSEYARQLLALINNGFRGAIAGLSDAPEGDLADVDNPDLEIAGSFVAGDKNIPFTLVRVAHAGTGPIWLVSQQTLNHVPALYLDLGSPRLAQYFPGFLMNHSLAGVPFAQWLGWLLTIPASLAAAWALVWIAYLLVGLHRHRRYDHRKPRERLPLVSLIAILVNGAVVWSIGLPLLYRVYYFRLLAVLLTITSVWVSARLADRIYRNTFFSSLKRDSRSVLQLLHRLYNASIVIIAILIVATVLGFHTSTMLAGLGIGGIALALAAQRLLEGLLGGITLVLDKTAAAGDECMIAGRYVTVQEIGLRSLRVITREGTEMAIPNGLAAQSIIENFSRRSRFLISTSLSLSYESSLAQLQCVIAGIREILYAHVRVEQKTARIRLSGVTPAGYQVNLFAYVRASDGIEFEAIQEDILFRIVKVVESLGASWAIPSQVAYLAKGKASDEGKIAESEKTVQNWRDRNQVPFPDFTPGHIADVQGTLAYPPNDSASRQQ